MKRVEHGRHTHSERLADLAADIRNVLVERGSLTQSEIISIWELDEARFEGIKSLLAREPGLIPGPKGRGGFRIRAKIGERLPAEEEGSERYFTSEWETGAVERLVGLLTHKELEDLLGDLVYTVRRARREITGQDRRGTKHELASALIVQHGNDLFCSKDARQLVARKCGARFPKKWMPGKDSAIAFVQTCDFPLVFAGAPSDDARPDFEFLKGRIDLQPLSEFQKEVGHKMFQKIHRQDSRAIVTLPTGAGKTRVAVDTIRDWLIEHWTATASGKGNTVLWLAHTEELCEQAYMCFRDVWQASTNVSPLWLIRFWGRYTQDLSHHWRTLVNLEVHPAVLVSTPQRIVNLHKNPSEDARNVVNILNGTLGLLLIDEAHRAAAPSYRSILDATAAHTGLAVVGLTATPFRTADPQAGARELRGIFREIIEPIDTLGPTPHVELQKRGYLAKPIWETIKTNTIQRLPAEFDLDSLGEEDIDKIDHALKARADNTDRRMVILGHILPICKTEGTQLIYFGPSVLDAECMAFLLRQSGVSAAFLSGETRDITRRRIINDFKEGRTKVLCNCEVLTTGFDAPQVTHVIMARPTVSQVMYEQMLGRGLRGPKFGGTENCVVVDCEDNYPGGRPDVGYEAFRRTWGV